MTPASFSPSLCLCAFLFRIVLEYGFVHSAPVYPLNTLYRKTSMNIYWKVSGIASTVHGVLEARILEWFAIPSSSGLLMASPTLWA